jgi:DNA-binding NtrC family response regulator
VPATALPDDEVRPDEVRLKDGVNTMTESETRVLVVDDDDQVRKFLQRVLEREGYLVLPASDAGKALELLERNDIHLVLLDLHMPGAADGEDLLFLLRDRGDDVPIIIASGYVDDESTGHQPDCVHAVLKKPVHIEALVSTVREVLALS